MSAQDPSILHVVGAAIFRENACMGARRAAHKKDPLAWEFPGGQVEADETPQEALARELYEEMNVHISVGDFIARGAVKKGTRLIVLDVYEAHILAGELTLRDHDKVRWFQAEELGDVSWSEPDWPALKVIQARLRDR